MALERQLHVENEHPDVASFWERFDYLEEREDANTQNGINQHRDPKLIGVSLSEFEARCAALGLKIPLPADLRKNLKTSKARRFVDAPARSTPGAARASTLWIFQKPEAAQGGGRMTPGTYLRLRREAAGLTIDDVVMLITPDETCWPPRDRPHLGDRARRGRAVDAAIRDALRGSPSRSTATSSASCSAASMPPPEICAHAAAARLSTPATTRIPAPAPGSAPARDLCTHCARKSAGAITEENDHASCRRAA